MVTDAKTSIIAVCCNLLFMTSGRKHLWLFLLDDTISRESFGFLLLHKNFPCTSSLQQICVEDLKEGTKGKRRDAAEGAEGAEGADARGKGVCCESEI